MSQPKARTPGSRWARCARGLGLDGNPLRRRADRVEAALRVALLILILTVVPAATIGVGRAIDHMGLRQARAQQMADHLVSAVLTQKALPTGDPDPYHDVPTVWVNARWTAPDGSARSGLIAAPVGSRQGSSAPTWVTASGTTTDPPETHKVVLINVFVAVMATGLMTILSLIGLQLLAFHVLDRRRMNAWDAEWRAIGPPWTGHHA